MVELVVDLFLCWKNRGIGKIAGSTGRSSGAEFFARAKGEADFVSTGIVHQTPPSIQCSYTILHIQGNRTASMLSHKTYLPRV